VSPFDELSNQLIMLSLPLLAQSGSYLTDGKVDDNDVAPHAADPENAKKLWELSEKFVGQEFSI